MDMSWVVRLFPVAALLVMMMGLEAAVYSPRALSPHVADTYSMKTFAQFPRWHDLSGDAKVFEIFKYLADSRTGVYPLGVPAWEGDEELSEYGAVRDPVKMLNVYPIGHCGTLGPTMGGIMEGMGIGPARTLIIPGWHHVASEAFYDGRWHYLDLDVRAVFRREDGSLASMAEAQQAARLEGVPPPEAAQRGRLALPRDTARRLGLPYGGGEDALWDRPNGPHFFPLDPIDQVRRTYASTAVEHRYGVGTGGHTMDYVLRSGETFTRWWKPQGGRWNHHPTYAESPFPRDVIEREPRGPKCKHESFTVHTHGNGRFVYRPDLTSESVDFADGVHASRNVEPGPDGLSLKEPGEGYAIFEVRSPYVIVPLVGDLDDAADDREASVVKLEATNTSLSLSLDHGLSWRGLDAVREMSGGLPRPVRLTSLAFDLTPHVSGSYGYLLKLTLRGQPAQAVVRSFEITTWVQLHPASLPALRKGTNAMRLVTGDHYGLPTRVLEIRPSAAKPDEFLKYLVEPPRDYDPARRTSRVRGAFIAKAEAPPGTKIAWFSAGASFQAHQGEGARNTRNAIAYAVDQPTQFRKIYRAEVPTDQSHWHYNVDREVKLDRPARAVFIRYMGDPAANNIRLYAHCLDDPARASAPVRVTHRWTENGVAKTRQVHIESSGGYEIVTEIEPVDDSIEMAVPSRAAP